MGLQKWMVNALFKSPKNLEDMAGIFKIARALNSPKKVGHYLTSTLALAEKGLKEMGTSSMAHYTKANHARSVDGT